MKEADKQEEEGGVRESSHAENGRELQPVMERELLSERVLTACHLADGTTAKECRVRGGQGEA